MFHFHGQIWISKTLVDVLFTFQIILTVTRLSVSLGYEGEGEKNKFLDSSMAFWTTSLLSRLVLRGTTSRTLFLFLFLSSIHHVLIQYFPYCSFPLSSLLFPWISWLPSVWFKFGNSKMVGFHAIYIVGGVEWVKDMMMYYCINPKINKVNSGCRDCN